MSVRRPSSSALGPPPASTHLIIPLIALVVVAIAMDATGLDLRWSDAWYDAATRCFPLRRSWWASTVLHRRLAQAIIALGCGAGAIALLSWPVPRLARWRGDALAVAATLAVSSAAVAALKIATGRWCPYELARYGGHAAYAHLLAPAIEEGGRGFPSSHAALGFAWTALYFRARRRGARGAAAWLVPGIVLGVALTAVQVARGAHFASHGVWSAAICWCTAYAVDAATARRAPMRSATARPREA